MSPAEPACAIASIVIPAHNEAAVIQRTLRGLLHGTKNGEFEVIVACNGCTDGTAALVREFGTAVQVVEIETPSKIAALNAGDDQATVFPRIYLDADIVIDADAIRRTAMFFGDSGVLAASPELHVDAARSSWPVRAFYRVWLSRGYHRRNRLGAGFYALSQDGRARFDRFPKIIADDEYVRRLFTNPERGRVPHASFTVHAPRRLRDLIKVKTRSRLGRYELRQRFPELFARRETDHSKSNVPDQPFGRRCPWHWPDFAAYYLVALATLWRARRQFAGLSSYTWERDDTSRDLS